jgi:hypothetical protein
LKIAGCQADETLYGNSSKRAKSYRGFGGIRNGAPISRPAAAASSSFDLDMAKYKSPSKFCDEHMRLLGLVAAHWEWVELTLERTVAEAMEHEYYRVGLLTENIFFHGLCDILMIYTRPAETLRPDIWTEFNKMLIEIKTAYSTRNKYVHGKWRLEKRQMKLSEVRTKSGKLKVIDVVVSVNELASAAKEIWKAGERLLRFAQSCGLLHTP